MANGLTTEGLDVEEFKRIPRRDTAHNFNVASIVDK